MAANPETLTESIVREHLSDGRPEPGQQVAVDIDHVLLQDVLGPLVWMEFEALDYGEVDPLVAQYLDHQVLQFDERDTAIHRYLRTVTRSHGGHLSKSGNGICHQVHRETFVEPGVTLVGSDSHSPTVGGFGALGIGAGGLDVAVSMSGEPYTIEMPEVVAVRLEGDLGAWTSAKDVVLELLRRLTVKGGVGKVFEFVGPGVESLSVPERCTIANMTTELGATSGIFPSDERTRKHLARLGRKDAYRPLAPAEGAEYDDEVVVDLAALEPLVASPGMPDNVVPVSEAAGTAVDQVVVGSCTNGSYHDVATVASVLEGATVAGDTDLVVAPASKRATELLARTGGLAELLAAGASVGESTCGACLGQGHVPAPDSVSLRTFNRNFTGRSGNEEDAVYLCSPEVAAASAAAGELVDPRETSLSPPAVTLPDDMTSRNADLLAPDADVEVRRGEVIGHVPVKESMPQTLAGPALIKGGDDITTDHIIPATAEVISKWADPQACADHTLVRVDPEFPARARKADGGFVVAGENYGQGSSRENAAIELVVLDVDGVLAKSFARIHEANLVNFGLLPMRFVDPDDYDRVDVDDDLEIEGDVVAALRRGDERLTVRVNDDVSVPVAVDLTERQRAELIDGGKLAHLKNR
jgi:aconitate hydratase